MAVFAALFAVSAYSQTCPAGFICLTQAEANAAAQNARELAATKEKVTVLESAAAEKDRNYQELKAAKEKNEADLKEALHKTEVALATKTGEVIQLEADRVRWNAVIDVLVKNSRKKSIGLIAF